MIRSELANVYKALPVPLQHAALSLYGWREKRKRFGPVFEQRLAWLKETEGWSLSDIASYQDEQVQRMVRFAYEYVPYYRGVMKERRLMPEDVRSRADLHKLPILTKADVREHAERLVPQDYELGSLVQQHTSGTTGTSLHFVHTEAAVAFQWAVWWRHRARFGVHPGDLHANLCGKPVVPASQRTPPYWRWNLPFSQALISMQQIVPEKVPAIVDFLDRHPFVFFSGYPSIAAALSATALELGLKLSSPPKAVFLGAENTLENQKQAIEAFTGALVSDQYGFSEGAGNASKCEHGVYHEDFEFGILECLDAQVDGEGNRTGDIVATGFANQAFPFLRYRVGDVGTWAPEEFQCPCGRKSAVIRSIDGRIEDYVLTPEGARIMRCDYLFKDALGVKEAQVVQTELGAITVRIVPADGFDQGAEEAAIRALTREFISPTLHVNFEYVDAIERSATGKLRAVRSYIS